MKALALFGGAGILTAAIAGGEIGIALGNLALAAASAALFLGTLSIDRAR
ncbi:MAG: hypothetical protein R3F65_04010 [bacterium]|nr:hypothetical protein [Myxococcales bacterium]MCB9551285.1 hypothetical protein [Myxococcales bacterium]